MTADATAAPPALVVGFDLDMTLIDSRPGIRATHLALSAETGVRIDADLAVSRLGPPVADELAHWFPADRIPEAVARYRALYPHHAVTPTPALPGAVAALAAVREAGGRSMVVTAKAEPGARLHLDHLGLDADALVGGLWAEAKGTALLAAGATVFVGDHAGDMRGAAAAGAFAVGVPTGPCDGEELRAAGADVVLHGGLPEFPGWLAAHQRSVHEAVVRPE